MKDFTRHKIKINEWFEMEAGDKLANRIVNLGWCFGVAAVLAALPDVIQAIAVLLQ